MTTTNLPEWIEAELSRMREAFLNRGLPDYMWEGTRLYVMQGIPPGHFLTRVVENSLSGAFAYADENNRRAMHGWCMFFYNNAPSGCWGSPAKVSDWIEKGGLIGIHAASEKEDT